jgi:hypothetical protein
MSYYVSIGKFDGNMSRNCSPMWDKAMPELNLRDMNGMLGKDCKKILRKGILTMANNRPEYISLNPINDWGDYGSALSFLIRIHAACKKHGSRTMWVSY